ncbi:MAG: [Clostridia bacterium]|nr:[citrate (pro-3S)-lyase] ligase [Clostridia bacterium]
MVTGAPMQGTMLERLKAFLRTCDLDYDESIRFTAALMADDEIIATASLDGSSVKCVAVSPAHQGEDLAAQIMTAVFVQAAQQGLNHLMLYTKPHNQYLFQGFGFHPVIRTADCLLMENRRGGLSDFLSRIPASVQSPVGCIVAHCNPFTLGHRYLIETAASECAHVYVFILSEDRGMFSPDERMRMAREACQDILNVSFHPTGPYMVSSSTFPSYFIKDKVRVCDVHCDLDIRLFGERIAPALGITRRYVGTEPGCAVTERYNRRMRELLPHFGVSLIEVERKASGGSPISASRVRQLLSAGRTDELALLLPNAALELIQSNRHAAGGITDKLL